MALVVCERFLNYQPGSAFATVSVPGPVLQAY